jgi:acyl carrier protein
MDWLSQVILVIAIITVIAIPLGIWQARAKRKKIEKAFANRQTLDERAFYERYFESRGVPFFVVSRVRKILEDELDADLSRLSSEDDFSQNLSFFWDYDSMADVEIVARLEEEFRIKITDIEAAQSRTVEDIVNLVWNKLSPTSTPDSQG